MKNINKMISAYNHYSYNNPKYIVLHYVGAKSTAKNNATYFFGGDRNSSAHYFVDDNEIWQSVEDNCGSWSVGNTKTEVNNNNSINIEMCCLGPNLLITEKTEQNTIELVKHLMKKYNIPIQNIKTHYEVTGRAKVCPNWSANNWERWNNFKNKLVAVENPTQINNGELYRIRKTWNDVASQIGAYSNLENAKRECKSGYSVFDSKGNKVYPITSNTNSTAINVGSKVKIIGNRYATGESIPSWINNNTYTVQEMSNDKALIKEIVSWVYVKDLVLANGNTVIPQPTASSKKYLNLKPHVQSWRVYRTNVAPKIGNECGSLAPKNYGGLSYQILGNPQTDVYTIQTSSFGKVNIYAPRDNDSSITDYIVYK